MELVFYNGFSERSIFQMQEGSRPWHVLLMLTQGEFSISFPQTGRRMNIKKHEILYIPAGMYFTREIVLPISFHQFAFFTTGKEPFFLPKREGRVEIPYAQVAALADTLARVETISENRDSIIHFITHILALHTVYGASSTDDGLPYDRDMQEILSYMKTHLEERFGMEDLAERFHLSHTGLIWKFHRHLGTTPIRFLTDLRLRYAKQLLLEGNLHINEIADRCGFSSAYYFTKLFRKHFDMSPGAFRSRYLG